MKTAARNPNSQSKNELHENTKALQAADLVGYNGTKLTKSVDKITKDNDKHNKEIDNITKDQSVRLPIPSCTKAVSFSSARRTKRFPSPSCAAAIQIVRPLESITEPIGFAEIVSDDRFLPEHYPVQATH